MTDYQFPADVPTKPFFEEVTAIYGGRGSGKTTQAKALIMEHQPPQLVWIDPTQPANTSLSDLRAKIRAGERSIQFGVAHPDLALAALMYCYGESTKAQPIYVVCDEAKTYLAQKRADVAAVFNMGRHAGLGVLLLTQRPSGIHPDYRTQAARTLWGRLTDSTDLSVAQQRIGREQAQQLQTAQPGQFIES